MREFKTHPSACVLEATTMRHPDSPSPSGIAQGRANPKQLFQRLTHCLFAPSSEITEPDQRRQATMLSGILLGIIMLSGVSESVTVALIDWTNYTGYRETIIATSGLFIAYIISRTRHVQIAAILGMIIAVVAAFISGLSEPRGVLSGILDYLILPLWISSLYIDLKKLAFLIGVTLTGLLLFPCASQKVSLSFILIGPFSFILITSVILLVITHHRNQLEQDRRSELDILVSQVQQSNTELSQAYESTIEGWSRVLDLRDKETEGHSRRVTELTLKLAQIYQFSDTELVHIRRGALLHDIGKMGVPDRILLKAGPLTEEEWEIMRMHPTYAYKMLHPIAYLRPALDIPYCHHEKWDGSGYPRGLRGKQIPLAARIFAMVDVWDAITSDRPYCNAWPKNKARDHIRAQAGKHFDPNLVEHFLTLIEEAEPDFVITPDDA